MPQNAKKFPRCAPPGVGTLRGKTQFDGDPRVIMTGGREFGAMAGKLTARGVESLAKTKGRYGDGQGLFLRVLDPGKRAYWCYRYRLAGVEREMSLGSYFELSLAEARLKHAEAHKRVAVDKIDPVAEKRAARSTATSRSQTARASTRSPMSSSAAKRSGASWGRTPSIAHSGAGP